MGADETTQKIAEYSRILSQLLCDVIEHNYLAEQEKYLLSQTQFTILKILFISGPYTVSEIADILHVSRAAASKNIDKLVRSKLVKRKITREDRRTMEISLTDEGSQFVKKYESIRLEKQQAALAHFNTHERNNFLQLLQTYVQSCVEQEKNIDLICLQCNGLIGKDCTLAGAEDRCQFYYRINKKYLTIEEED